MLPTKGYFQDIECPYFNSSCGRPYCHFRHRKKQSEYVEEIVADPDLVVPTYNPTPKSQLANIHNNRSHIPISYVPDLAFRADKKPRSNPIYNPTPLSILSSANNKNQPQNEENKEHLEVINEIKQNIANVEYDPTISLQNVEDIDFEDLSNEFDLIDEIINSDEKSGKQNSQNELEKLNKKNSVEDNKAGINFENSITKSTEALFELTSKDKVSKKALNEKSNKTDKSSNKEVLKCDIPKNKESENVSSSRSKKDNKEKSVSNRKSSTHKKIEKKHSITDKSKSPSHESIIKNKDKHTSAEKYKHRDDSKKSKKDHEHNSKHKEKHKSQKLEKSDKEVSNLSKSKKEKSDKEVIILNKSKKIDKSDKEVSNSKYDKKHSSEIGDKSDHKKNKEKSDNRSHSKSKEHKSSKDNDKKRKHREKEYNKKDRDKAKHIKFSEKNETSMQKKETSQNEFNFLDNANCLESDSDIDDVNEDETMLECYKIFNEYNPPQIPQENEYRPEIPQKSTSTIVSDEIDEYYGKKRIAHPNVENSSVNYSNPKYSYTKPKTVETPGQILNNRYKLAKMAQANREQELLMNEMHQSIPTKRPPPSLLEAARERKKIKEMEKSQQSTNLIDDILKGTTSSSIQKAVVKKIAPARNVLALAKAKERISKIKPTIVTKTIAQTQKGNRVAHVPDISLSDIPDVLQANNSKLPVNVRTRFLTMLADECVKLYISKDEAYSRSLKEEFNCYEKCKVLTSYRNSAMLAVNRLRKEIQERNKNGLGLIGVGEDEGDGSCIDSKSNQMYNKIKHWVLTQEELDIHGYPQQSNEHGVAIIKNFKSQLPSNLDENQRICCRCRKIYQVDDDGWPLFEEECSYHPMKKRTIRGEQTYLCCRSGDEIGCATSDAHVSDGFASPRLEGYQITMESDDDSDSRSYAVYALDCEMCYTTKGLELTRVTIVDTDCKTVYESLVKPLNPIIDYNTKFSGITKEQMDRTSTSILQVQANILHLCNSRTILVGHSLESDLKALKIVHGNVIDTAVLFPHKMGLPHKRALRALASEFLRKIIQNDVSGHDSAEDAITCMELLHWKLKEDTKRKS